MRAIAFLGMGCARAAANSYPPASKKPCARAVVLLRPKLCARVIALLHPKLCARSVTPSALEKLRAIVGRALLVSVFAKQPRLFSAPPSRLAQKPPVPSRALRASVKRLAKLTRKTVVEILFRKVFLKFYFTKF